MQSFILKGDLQFSKFLKNTNCIGLCKLNCTEKRFIPFPPLHFLPEFVPHTEFKGRPEGTKWNVLYHTALRNYAAIIQVPSILSILLGVLPPQQRRSTLAGRRGGWGGGSIFWKTQDIGLASYSNNLSTSLPVGDAHDRLADLQVLLVDLLLELVEGWSRPCLELGRLTPRLLYASPHRHAPAESTALKG